MLLINILKYHHVIYTSLYRYLPVRSDITKFIETYGLIDNVLIVSSTQLKLDSIYIEY